MCLTECYVIVIKNCFIAYKCLHYLKHETLDTLALKLFNLLALIIFHFLIRKIIEVFTHHI